MVNPDGAEYDISGGQFHYWRKNRQPTPGTTSIGTDLNRNYSYHWGGGGRTSANPQAITYRGPRAFSTPEDRAMRDFMASRVVDGRQQIRAAITFHENGRLVMWPYGYTMADVPSDMTTQDHAALVKHRAGTWPRPTATSPSRRATCTSARGRRATTSTASTGSSPTPSRCRSVDYPDDSMIASETGRNKEAVLYLMERAWCPLAVLGATVRTARCGAFDDDLEVVSRLDVEPGRHRHRAVRGRLRPGEPGVDDEPRPEAARDDARPAPRRS